MSCSTFRYSGTQESAERMIKKFGRKLTFTRLVKGEYAPTLGRTINDTTTTYTAYAVQSNWTTSEKTAGNILDGDIKLIAEVADYKKDDNISIDGKPYKIESFEKIQPASDRLLYILQVRA